MPAVHAAIAQVDALVDLRRTLYLAATELVRSPAAHPLPQDLIDSPSVRGRIGRALATGDAAECAELIPISAVVSDAGWLADGPFTVPVASLPESNRLLADALRSVDAQLAEQRPASSLRLLTEADDLFAGALALVRAGIALARSISPALVDDLLPHVALVGIVDSGSAEPLVSASSRAFPGLVLIGCPRSAIEVAEALVHEAAHQKLFDLAITGAMLSHESDRCPPFQPTWPPARRRWQMEQALAAGHAYACLAEFADDAAGMPGIGPYGPDSLLPVARERCNIIGAWLLGRGNYLGADAHRLLEGLHGRPPMPELASESRYVGRQIPSYTVGSGLNVHRCAGGHGVVIGRMSQPPELYVVKGDAATILDLLAGKPTGEVLDALARRSAVSSVVSARQVAALVASLSDLGLVRTDDH